MALTWHKILLELLCKLHDVVCFPNTRRHQQGCATAAIRSRAEERNEESIEAKRGQNTRVEEKGARAMASNAVEGRDALDAVSRYSLRSWGGKGNSPTSARPQKKIDTVARQ